MDSKPKIYKQDEEIDRAWKELVDSIKPLNVTRFKSSATVREDLKITNADKKQRLHHPALITEGDFKNWDFLI